MKESLSLWSRDEDPLTGVAPTKRAFARALSRAASRAAVSELQGRDAGENYLVPTS